MAVSVSRTNVRINPDHKKVIPRFFNTGSIRSRALIDKISLMEKDDVTSLLQQVLYEFSVRYKNIRDIFLAHFEEVRHVMEESEVVRLSPEQKLLIGSYFTMEYSIEAAALFNPSIVDDPDQRGAGIGQRKVIISFRATGESHISSIVFKQGFLDENAHLHLEGSGKFISEGIVSHRDKEAVANRIALLNNVPQSILANVLDQAIQDRTYKEIRDSLDNELSSIESTEPRCNFRFDVLTAVNTAYQLDFSEESLLSERVIFPVTKVEKNGIEDARFVRFVEDDGSIKFIATYTAYDGAAIKPQFIITRNFLHFDIVPILGKCAINKNLALFPRKVNGQYVMLSRLDNINNYIMFSDDLFMWEEATLLQQPMFPWEYVQIGNGGSPLETEKGWLVITHGVGPMRKYCLGASLFDLNDPAVELGRLKEPILVPNEDERDGYVPNVVYSCGSIIHGDTLFIPYAVSDYASSFATVVLKDLLTEILNAN